MDIPYGQELPLKTPSAASRGRLGDPPSWRPKRVGGRARSAARRGRLWCAVDQSGTVARMTVSETFFSLEVTDMQRATRFFVDALGATVIFESAAWSSLRIAGVRVGLFLHQEHTAGHVGLHFVVSDLGAARNAVERAGGRIATFAIEVAPGVVIAQVTDTEGNTFTLRQA